MRPSAPSLLFGLLALLWTAPVGATQRVSTSERLVMNLFAPLRPALERAAEQGQGIAWAVRLDASTSLGPQARFESVLAGLAESRLGGLRGLPQVTAVTAAPGASLDEVREAARTAGVELLLLVDGYVKGGRVHLTGELHRVHRSFWSRLRRPVAGLRSIAYASARLDAELRALLDLLPSPATSFRLDPGPALLQPEGEVLAAAVADVDGDGLQEVALLEPGRLRLVRVVADAAAAVRTVSLGDSLRAAVRARDRFGTLVAADLHGGPAHELLLWTSDLTAAVALGWRVGELRPVGLPGAGACEAPMPAGALCAVPLATLPPPEPGRPEVILAARVPEGGVTAYPPALAVWTTGARLHFRKTPGLHWTAAAHALVLPEPGQSIDLSAVVDAKGRLVIGGGEQTWTVAGVGTAVVIGDLEDDGTAEVVTSGDGLDATDRLTVTRLGPGGETRTLWQSATPPIRGLAFGDIDNDGRREVLVLSTSVRVLRPAS